jgi:hypothetical protein
MQIASLHTKILSQMRVCLPQIDAKSSWLSLRHCNTSGMTLAGRWARSRLQIELVIVENVRITESSKEPSTEYTHKARAKRAC